MFNLFQAGERRVDGEFLKKIFYNKDLGAADIFDGGKYSHGMGVSWC